MTTSHQFDEQFEIPSEDDQALFYEWLQLQLVEVVVDNID